MRIYLLTAKEFRTAQQLAVNERNKEWCNFLKESNIFYFLATENLLLTRYMGKKIKDISIELESELPSFLSKIIELRVKENPKLRIYFSD